MTDTLYRWLSLLLLTIVAAAGVWNTISSSPDWMGEWTRLTWG